ncbi:MAG: Uma2 family endonuclease [Cyanobacteriota bacterium]|nr:Uma2 family endonuclease [Cyanobacteriota bacterium]
MSTTQTPIPQSSPPRSPKETLPTMYDLKSESPEEPGLPDEYHLWQGELSSITFRPSTHPIDQILVASDLNLYYDPNHTGWYKRPDWYAVVGVPRLYEGREPRLSYVFWQEGVRPIIALEFLSPGTRSEDLGETERGGEPPTKWEVYEQILGIPYYIVFDRYTDELRVFWLEGGCYREQELEEGRIWLPALGIGIGLWLGEYRGLTRQWLRWYDGQRNWIPTPAEEAETAERRAEAATQRAQAAERAIALGIPRLLNMGLSAEQVAEALGLSVEEVNSRMTQ